MNRKVNLLFICTHNRCRSILAEAITQKMASEYFIAKSAGSTPVGQVHPNSIKYLKQNGYDTEMLLSKSWHDMGDFKPDICITVCDKAAGESCPLWLGESIKIHWGIEDPSLIISNNLNEKQAFENTIALLEKRLAYLCAHQIIKLNLTEIGQLFQQAGEL